MMKKEYFFDKASRSCRIYDSSGQLVNELSTEIEINDEYDPTEYDVLLLYNDLELCSENSIFQVYVDDVRIGWIFPVEAIHSNEHSYASDEFFLKYAYVAWCHLISINYQKLIDIDDYNFFDEYPVYTNLLVLCKENCQKVDFSLNRYLVSLFQYGYAVCGKGNLLSNEFEGITTKIKLKRQSPLLDDCKYLNDIFTKTILSETTTIGRFYFYYQVIEILIAKVFDIRFMTLIDDIKKSDCELLKKRDRIIELSQEKRRVKCLINNFCFVDDSIKNDLHDKCVQFLNCVGESIEKDDSATLLYNVRCIVVHRMYIINNIGLSYLREIDDLFLELIIQLILTFKEPENQTELD